MTVPLLFAAELKRVLASPGCPLCTFSREDDESYLGSLLQEGLSNVGLLDRLSLAGGFCAEHAWALQRMEQRDWHGGLTNACFERPLLAEALLWLDQLPTSPRAIKKTSFEVAECPACASRARMDRNRAAGLAEALGEERFADLYAKRRQALCMPHFRLVWRQHMAALVRESLRDAQRSRLQDLVERLDRYLWKHKMNVSEPKSPEEVSSWTEAVAMLSGDAAGQTEDGT
jgi:hypothetical protein